MPAVPPPLYALGAALVQHRLAGPTSPSLLRGAAAGVIGAASGTLIAGSIARFRSRRTTVEPFQPAKASALVTDGPNAITRNPMYVGMAGLLLAHAVGRGSWAAVLPVAGFVVVIDRLQIRPEEAALQDLFGEEYAAYCARVPRWVVR
ncbi:isoprenylcysteine carboxylmethyltransferase family protein [Nocardioides sp. BGMRC 2183]|nr:isoprenylcysteine carboxylmethyltransferase family protein [Nocardioides sp. BGMRC 2183]